MTRPFMKQVTSWVFDPEAFRKAREANGISGYAVCRKAGVSGSLVCQLELGYNTASAHTTEKLISALEELIRKKNQQPTQFAEAAAGNLGWKV